MAQQVVRLTYHLQDREQNVRWMILWFILSGERNNYEEEIIIISGLPRVWTGLRVARQIRWDSKLGDLANCATVMQGILRCEKYP